MILIIQMMENELQEAIKDMDQDKSGEIGINEFITWWKKQDGSEFQINAKEHIYGVHCAEQEPRAFEQAHPAVFAVVLRRAHRGEDAEGECHGQTPDERRCVVRVVVRCRQQSAAKDAQFEE